MEEVGQGKWLTWKFITPVQTKVEIRVATICATNVCLGGICQANMVSIQFFRQSRGIGNLTLI